MISFYEKADIRKKYKYPLNLLTMAMCSEDNKHELYKGKAKYSGPLLEMSTDTIDDLLTLCILYNYSSAPKALGTFLDYFRHNEQSISTIRANHPEFDISGASMCRGVMTILNSIRIFHDCILPDIGDDISELLSSFVRSTNEMIKQRELLGISNPNLPRESRESHTAYASTCPGISTPTLTKAYYTSVKDVFPENIASKFWEKGLCSVADIFRCTPIELMVDGLISYDQSECDNMNNIFLDKLNICFSKYLNKWVYSSSGEHDDIDVKHVFYKKSNDVRWMRKLEWPMNFYFGLFGDPKYACESVSILPDDWEESIDYVFKNKAIRDRERDVVYLHLKDGLTFSSIGKEYYNVTGSRIQGIFHSAMRKLRHPSRSRIIGHGLKGYEEFQKLIQDEKDRKRSVYDSSIKYLIEQVVYTSITTDDLDVKDLNKLYYHGITTYGNVLSYSPSEFKRICCNNSLYTKIRVILKKKHSIVVESSSKDDYWAFTDPEACSVQFITNTPCYRFNKLDDLLGLRFKDQFDTCSKRIMDVIKKLPINPVFSSYGIKCVADIVFYKPSSIERIFTDSIGNKCAEGLFSILRNYLQIGVDRETDTWVYDKHYIASKVSLDDIDVSNYINDKTIDEHPEWDIIFRCLRDNDMITVGSIVKTTPHLLNYVFDIYDKGLTYSPDMKGKIKTLTTESIVSVEFNTLLTLLNNKFKIFMSVDNRSLSITDWVFRSTDYLLMKPDVVKTDIMNQINVLDEFIYNNGEDVSLDMLTVSPDDSQPVLTRRAHTCLVRAGIYTLGKLMTYTQTDLLKIRNMGRRSIENIEEVIKARYNLELPSDEI